MITIEDHRNGVALTRAYLAGDTEAFNAVAASCDPVGTVTALLGAYTELLAAVVTDPDVYLQLVQQRLNTYEADREAGHQ